MQLIHLAVQHILAIHVHRQVSCLILLVSKVVRIRVLLVLAKLQHVHRVARRHIRGGNCQLIPGGGVSLALFDA
jgi:hypothetical protein